MSTCPPRAARSQNKTIGLMSSGRHAATQGALLLAGDFNRPGGWEF